MFNYSPQQIVLSKKKLTKTKFFFGRILFSFFLFSSIPEKHFCEQIPFLLVLSIFDLSFENSSVFLKMNLSRKKHFCGFLSSNCSSILFSSLLVFKPSRFAFTSFFISCFVWSFYFLDLLLLVLIFLYLHFFDFFEQQVPFFLNQKTLQIITFHMHALPPFVLFCSYICSSVVIFFVVFSRFDHMCFPFPSFVFSVHNLFWKQVYVTSTNSKKQTCLSISFFVVHFWSYLFLHVCPSFFDRFFFFLFYSHLFLNIFLFGSRCWICFSSVAPILCISFFEDSVFGLIIVFSPLFKNPPVTYSPFF